MEFSQEQLTALWDKLNKSSETTEHPVIDITDGEYSKAIVKEVVHSEEERKTTIKVSLVPAKVN